nr:MAG TPA: terminase small subunit [Caudoviricetes sp.]
MTTEEKILSNAKSVEEWILGGLPEKEVAAALGIGYSTFRKAKKENNLIRDLVNGASQRYKKEQEKIQSEKISQVRSSLFQRCLGYNVDLPKHYKVKRVARDADGEVLLDAGGKPIMEDVLEQVMEKQHVPADVTAIKFFLMNQDSKEWQSDPERLKLDRKRVANDTKRTKLAESAAGSGETAGKSLEDILAEAEGDVY